METMDVKGMGHWDQRRAAHSLASGPPGVGPSGPFAGATAGARATRGRGGGGMRERHWDGRRRHARVTRGRSSCVTFSRVTRRWSSCHLIEDSGRIVPASPTLPMLCDIWPVPLSGCQIVTFGLSLCQVLCKRKAKGRFRSRRSRPIRSLFSAVPLCEMRNAGCRLAAEHEQALHATAGQQRKRDRQNERRERV